MSGGSGQSRTAPTSRISSASPRRMVPSAVTAANRPLTSRAFSRGASSRAASSAALEAARELAPLEKARLVKGLFAAVTADGTIRLGEAELMRLVGAVLDCPLPPLIETLDPRRLAS